jgi:hypothetical protein
MKIQKFGKFHKYRKVFENDAYAALPVGTQTPTETAPPPVIAPPPPRIVPEKKPDTIQVPVKDPDPKMIQKNGSQKEKSKVQVETEKLLKELVGSELTKGVITYGDMNIAYASETESFIITKGNKDFNTKSQDAMGVIRFMESPQFTQAQAQKSRQAQMPRGAQTQLPGQAQSQTNKEMPGQRPASGRLEDLKDRLDNLQEKSEFTVKAGRTKGVENTRLDELNKMKKDWDKLVTALEEKTIRLPKNKTELDNTIEDVKSALKLKSNKKLSQFLEDLENMKKYF